jgi:hypothetical protein
LHSVNLAYLWSGTLLSGIRRGRQLEKSKQENEWGAMGLQGRGSQSTHPRLMLALRLLCPYCGVTHLRPPGAWFRFREGCELCNYRFEREPGYFSGAFQLVLFTIVALSALLLTGLGLKFAPQWPDTLLVIGVGVFILLELILLVPWAMAVWMWLDHRIHPLKSERMKEV